MIETIRAPLKIWAVTLTDDSRRVIEADVCHHPSGFVLFNDEDEDEIERLWFHRDGYGCVYSVPFAEVHSVDLLDQGNEE